MGVIYSIVVLFMSLLVPCLDCFHVTPSGLRAVSFSNSQNRNNHPMYTSHTYGATSGCKDSLEAPGNSFHQLEALSRSKSTKGDEANGADNDMAESMPGGDGDGDGEDAAATTTTTTTANNNVHSNTSNQVADDKSAMYVLFRVFDGSKETPEEDLYDIVQKFISSLVHDSFFDLRVFRESEGDMPPLFLVNFNSFKAYDFVRAQLYSRDASARELLNTFYFHISRHSPSPGSYPVQVANYMAKRTAYQQMLRLFRRNRYNASRRSRRPRYYGPDRYDRGLSMQLSAPVPAAEHMFQPPPIQGIHIHPMIPPPQYMGPMGHTIPSHHTHPPMG